MQAWNVYLKGSLIDTVFFSKGVASDHVKKCLIELDSMPESIRVSMSHK